MGQSTDLPSAMSNDKNKAQILSDDAYNIPKKVDIFRDTPLRYLGYANEVGEAFRAQVPVSVVRLSYVVASGYVCADAYSKGQDAAQLDSGDDGSRSKRVLHAVTDTLIWQGLASVAIPGFTINRICYLTNHLLTRTSSLPSPTRRWTVTMVGLGAIPFIIKPIDRSVDWLMEHTLRRWLHIESDLQDKIVHHNRNP